MTGWKKRCVLNLTWRCQSLNLTFALPFLYTETPFGLCKIQEMSVRGMQRDDTPLPCLLSADFPLSSHNGGSHLDSQDLIKWWAITKGLRAVNSICHSVAGCRYRDFYITRAQDTRAREIIPQLGPTVTLISCIHRGGE